MDKFINFSIFILVLLLPIVFFSMIIKSVPRLKMRDAAPYLDKISAIKDCVNAGPAGGEDMKKIKRSIQHSSGRGISDGKKNSFGDWMVVSSKGSA